MISAFVLADSVSPSGVRLTSMEVTMPRIVLPEFNTHRVFSKNSASSRAIPVEKQLARVASNPFVPVHWGKNQKGMQADEELSPDDQHDARFVWMTARDRAVHAAGELARLGVHKQITNRLLEPFMFHTVVVTATEWENFFALRTHKDAQPEIRLVAEQMLEAYTQSKPQALGYGEWHRPLIDAPTWEAYRNNPRGDDWLFWNKVSAGRCARVSYLTHDGRRDPEEDVKLCERLIASGHMSPMEHVARPMSEDEVQEWLCNTCPPTASSAWCGNFRGWVQFRKTLPNEAVWKP